MVEKISTTIDGHQLEISNSAKVFFPQDGITKGELIQYYLKIAPAMLLHLEDRPLSFQRFPDGIGGEGFFQKATPDYYPDWIKRAPLPGEKETTRYAIADSKAALVYFAQQAVITHHVWLSRRDKPHNPDLIIFDLDPQNEDFETVREAAFGLRELLTELKLNSYVKTTGSRGLHVAVPLDRVADFERAKAFARAVATHFESRQPEVLTTEIRIAKRGERIFIDTARNNYAQTAVAPYSVRARKSATVAVPITWKELENRGLKSDSFNINNVFDLLSDRPDSWQTIYRNGQSLDQAEKILESMH
ncbi:non-homologous end-joining DNA ligase [Dehalogenimonas sp. THU2]|uniref:non-homologous end-joining DNA ligase n=1 Tax=Dehalogenimonas sp. THU2 TaxID=3151121 RepID=UPI0032189F8A